MIFNLGIYIRWTLSRQEADQGVHSAGDGMYLSTIHPVMNLSCIDLGISKGIR